MATNDEPSWYLVHCKPLQDERALENLQRQGFECFRPMRSIERRREGRKHFVDEPLFPRYLFIHLDCVHDNWYPIRSTRGVHELVRFNSEKPLAVRDEIIEGIRTRLANPATEPYLKPGERVRITEGPFSQIEAIFLANDGDERVVLLMNILQTDQRVSFPLELVRKVAG
jgi:transcriptional antiterminator RfaH